MPGGPENPVPSTLLGLLPGLRVQVTHVRVTRQRDRGEHVLAVRVCYNIMSANVPGNNVIVAGLEEVVRMWGVARPRTLGYH